MADIRKTFNFRDGVQVDDEVLVVRGNRVGLGTTSPNQLLDVRGNANITGVTSTVNFNVTGVGTFGGVSLGSTINMDSTSGVITAVAYKGDGSTLSNLPTSQWTDVNVGAGVSPIYVEGNVGIGTTDPANPLQIGGNPNNGIGVGFSTSGNIKASGIITATTFSGSLIGNVTGDLTGTASTATLANTATVAVNAQGLTGSPSVTLSNLNVTGVGTVTSLEATSLTTPVFAGHNSLRAPHGTTTTIVVTVAAKTAAHRYNGSGSSNGFKLDGVEAPYLTLTPGRTYRFDVSDGTNAGHPLKFYYDVDKTTPYTTGVTVSGVSGAIGSYVDLLVTDTTPSVLHYQCQTHAKMGNSVQTGSNILDTNYNTTVRGTITATSFAGPLTGNVTGNLTGDVTGNTTGIHTGAVTGDVTGNLTGNVTGNITGNINSTGISTITRFFTDDISITGVSTHTGASIFNGNIDSNAEAEFARINVGLGTIATASATTLKVSGISTFDGAVDINSGVNISNNLVVSGDVDVDGNTELDNVNVSGITTSASFIGPLTGNVTGDATGLSGNPSINVTGLNVTGVSTVGVLTAVAIGVGTNQASTDIQIFNASSSSSIVIGKNPPINVNNLQLRYGGEGSNPFDGLQSLELINHGTGNFIYQLTDATSGFHWHRGSFTPLMSLTGQGSLGIGITDPETTFRLTVNGQSNFIGLTTFKDNVFIDGFLQVGDATISNLTGNVTGALTGEFLGISTIANLHVNSIGNVNQTQTGLGIGATSNNRFLTVGDPAEPRSRMIVSAGSTFGVGIGTDRISYYAGSGINGNITALEVSGPTRIYRGGLKVGGQPDFNTTRGQRCAVDFSDAINSTDFNGAPLGAGAYVLLPRVSTTQRNSLADGFNPSSPSSTLRSGALIYNTTLNKLQVYTGSGWETVTSS